MFTVTHTIPAAITLSTCSEVPSNEHTLNLHPYHMLHSTLALSTINLIVAHNSFCHKTQQAVPNRTHTSSVPTTAVCSISFVLGISYLCNLNALSACNIWTCTSYFLTISQPRHYIQTLFLEDERNFCLILATMLLTSQWYLLPIHLQQHQVSSHNNSNVIYSAALVTFYIIANFVVIWVSDWNDNCLLLQAQRSCTCVLE